MEYIFLIEAWMTMLLEVQTKMEIGYRIGRDLGEFVAEELMK